jgi:23S rRNA pseudouridine2605 synthase
MSDYKENNKRDSKGKFSRGKKRENKSDDFKPAYKKDSKEFGEKKWEKRPYKKREEGERYSDRDKKESGEKRFKKEDGGNWNKKPSRYSDNKEKRPYKKREEGERYSDRDKTESGEKRFKKEDGGNWNKKPSRYSDNKEKRPYKKREEGERYSDRDKKESGEKRFKKDDGGNWNKKPSRYSDNKEKRPYKKREEGERYSDRDKKESGEKRFKKDDGGKWSKKPSRYSDNKEKRPYKKREEGDRYSDKEKGEKPYYNKGRKPFRPKYKKSESQDDVSSDGSIRLNKYIANSGICSRREADQLIETGAVTVNGKTITQMGVRIQPGDTVKVGEQAIKNEKKVYILLNKPKDYITTTDDPSGRRTVMHLIRNATRIRVYPVGRLDRNTTGVLLFTNDGELTKKLTHPKHGARKIYHVHTDKNVSVDDLHRLVNGIEMEDGTAIADEASYVGDGADKKDIGVVLHSGKNRVVRRMFEALGYKVQKLDRVVFAGLTKKDLQRGRWRFLTEKEVSFLKQLK